MLKKKFCAHRGVSARMPENTLPAFAVALSLGADEIEFDVRLTRDNKLIVSHDGTLERISDGKGQLADFTLEELRELNVGIKHGWNVGFCTVEEVFEQFANRMTFNIHLKEHGEDGYLIKELKRLTEKYNAHDSVYFAASPAELEWMQKLAPEIRRAAIQLPGDSIGIYDMAKKYGCSGVQFWVGMFDGETIEKLHSDGLFCNVFLAGEDKVESYTTHFEMGVDTVLTNYMDLAADYRKKYM